MNGRRLTIAVSSLALCLALVRCGSGGSAGPDASTAKDTGSSIPPDAAAPGPDASGGSCDTIAKLRTDSACLNKPVSITGAVVVGSRPSGGSFEMYVQDTAGGSNSGIMVYFPKAVTANVQPKAHDVVDISGVVIPYNNSLELTGVDGGAISVTVTSAGTGTFPSAVPSLNPPTDLAPDSTTHDDAIGQRVKIPGSVTVIDNQPIEMAFWGKVDGGAGGPNYAIKSYNGVKLQGGALLHNTYTYQDAGCPLDVPLNNATGVWDWYKDYFPDGGPTYYRVFRPVQGTACQGVE